MLCWGESIKKVTSVANIFRSMGILIGPYKVIPFMEAETMHIEGEGQAKSSVPDGLQVPMEVYDHIVKY